MFLYVHICSQTTYIETYLKEHVTTLQFHVFSYTVLAFDLFSFLFSMSRRRWKEVTALLEVHHGRPRGPRPRDVRI